MNNELILDVPERLAGEVAVILRETMIKAGEAFLSRVPIEVDVTIEEMGRQVRVQPIIAISPNQAGPVVGDIKLRYWFRAP